MQALQDHLGAEEEDGGGGGGEEGDRQILQAVFWDGELMKVHFLQDQVDIGTERLRNV